VSRLLRRLTGVLLVGESSKERLSRSDAWTRRGLIGSRQLPDFGLISQASRFFDWPFYTCDNITGIDCYDLHVEHLILSISAIIQQKCFHQKGYIYNAPSLVHEQEPEVSSTSRRRGL
jgi:hypothetical protein